ncbi:MAG: type I glutamate--ammonia ligase [Bacillota bacterium]|jgi:glutamine synthetase
MYTKEQILELAEKSKVRFVRLQFTDIFGVLKNVAITCNQLEKALDGEMMFDGSSIDGFVRVEESDMYLKPDYSTWCILPWVKEGQVTARLICDVYNCKNQPFEGDPRYILRKVLAEAAAMGYSMNVGPEAEFFLFQTDAEGAPTLKTHDKAGYFDLTPVDLGENARRDMVITLENMGYEIEASHHECAPGQHEIDFKYAEALTAADNVQTFKYVVRVVSQEHNLHASFMPKPLFGEAGSGMHVNQSLFKGDKNAFFDPAGKKQLSEDAYFYLGGLLQHAAAYTAIVNPTVNSYKRLVSGYEAPVYIAWASQNRSPLIRVPAKKGLSTRVELRSPDPSCNPYLAVAVMLKAGLDGIKNKIMPPDPLEFNVYNLNEMQREEYRVNLLPGTLKEALEQLQESVLMREVLGDHVFNRFMAAKEMEWNDYRTCVTQWEIDHYLTKY